MMKTVSVYDAVGMVLCHDLTQIVPSKFKGVAFKKGHIVRSEDIQQLLEMGKEHLYVWEVDNDTVHEDDAAIRIASAAAGDGIELSEPKEGKVDLRSQLDGLLKINVDALNHLNEVDQIMLATIHANRRVERGKVVAGTRIIPLVIGKNSIEKAEEICLAAYPLITVKPLRSLRVGLVTTGSEVYYKRIEDRFGPVVDRKLEALGSQIMRQILVPDSAELIAESIRSLIADGAEMIAVTGGMSVDPDDLTPTGIRLAGGDIVTYGVPVLPCAMFMMAYIGSIPVVGLPGCVMYNKISIFDLVVPRILAGEKITRNDLVKLGHGGLCGNCPECHYPDCGFGQGS